MKRMYELQEQLTAITHHTMALTKEMAAIVDELRITLRILTISSGRSGIISTGNRHCFDIPICFVVEVDIRFNRRCLMRSAIRFHKLIKDLNTWTRCCRSYLSSSRR